MSFVVVVETRIASLCNSIRSISDPPTKSVFIEWSLFVINLCYANNMQIQA